MEQQKISVIVPVYKVEAYLDKCISSIVNQTYKNLEIILVDDGSPDRCGAMCDAWAEQDSRIRVIHKENGGPSDSRNAAMAVATGELMGFVDSDDTIHPDMYRLLYESMVENDSDISACGVEMVWEDGTPSRFLTKSGCCVLDQEEAMRALLEESWLKQPVWYKLYKTGRIRDLSFPVGKYHEDVFWTYQAVARARRVSAFDTVGYYYRQRCGSIMGETYSLKRLDAVEAAAQRCKWIETQLPSLSALAQRQLIAVCMYHSQQLLRSTDLTLRGAALHRLFTLAQQTGTQWKTDPELSAKQRLWLSLYLRHPRFVCQIRNYLHIGV